MSMTVKRVKDTQTVRVFMHKVADVRGGVAIKTSELGGDFIQEGAVISAPDNGICHVVKRAQLTAQSSDGLNFIVKKNHNFKVGDFVMSKAGGKAYAITAIKEAKDTDTITIGTTIGAVDQHAFIMEAAAQAESNTSALKNEPFAMVGTGKVFRAGENVDTDAWLIGVTKGNPLPAEIAGKLSGIINY